MGPSRSTGFTLTELLVVMAIIGVLASLTLPALSAAKQRAIRVHCLNNLRQIAVTVRLYADDNAGRLPTIVAANTNPPAGLRLRQALGGEVPAMFRCRGDRGGYHERNGSSYDWNEEFNGRLLHGSRADRDGAGRTGALVFDHEPWHGPKCNGAFPDGHVAVLEINDRAPGGGR